MCRRDITILSLNVTSMSTSVHLFSEVKRKVRYRVKLLLFTLSNTQTELEYFVMSILMLLLKYRNPEILSSHSAAFSQDGNH